MAEPLAVVGLSALFPGSRDAAGFWRDILAGRDLLTDVPETHWLIDDYYDPNPDAPDKTYARRGGFLQPMEFDPLEHGIPPNVVPATDSSQLLALIAAKQVLDDAIAGQFTHVDRDKTSIILGVTSAQELLVEMGSRLQRPVWVKALREHGMPEDEVQRVCDRIAASYTPWQENTFPGLLGNVVAGRIANRLNLGGTNCITDAACASSFAALQMGANELLLGQSDLAIVGGVETFNDIFMYMCFSKTPALSPTGDCRPFAKAADGTMLGEGIAMLALRRLADAERDGDRIYALVRGIGSSSDGRNKSVYAPVAEGQAKALRRAYAAAGYSPSSVELLEAHGTGTKAGDVAEFEGLRQVFEETGREERQWCALGSVKSQIGHTKATAGAAGIFKIVMALHHKLLPPTIKVDEPHPGLSIEKTPFYLNTRARPWIRAADHPRRASVSSFGFGGSNFHVTAEEYAGAGKAHERTAAFPSELVLFSAADAGALIDELRRIAASATDEDMLPVLARESHVTFDFTRPARLALVAGGREELRGKVAAALTGLQRSGESAFSVPGVHYAFGAEPGKVALLFPGQGSQYVEMGADIAMAFPEAREIWDLSADKHFPRSVHQAVFPPPAFGEETLEAQKRRLTATEWAQPALGAASAALLAVLRRAGVSADAFAGHSFGEVAALYAAGAWDFASFLRVAHRRGELMAEAAKRPGAMIAVAATPDEIRTEIAGDVVIANHNGPRQVVLSGTVEAIEATTARLKQRGMTVRALPVATAFHSPLVAPSSQPFAEFLDGIAYAAPSAPVFSTAEAAPYPSEPASARRLLATQIARPVRFVEMIEALYASGVRTFVEVGAGSVLTSLVDEILNGRPHAAVALDRKGQHGVTSLWNGLGRLAVQGLRLDMRRLLEGFVAPKDPRLRKKPAMSLAISGANYGKPYPPPGGSAALPKPNPPRPLGDATDRPAARPGVAPAWIDAYQQLQRQTAETHEAYLRTMGEAHGAFLKAAEASFATLHAMLGGRDAAVPMPAPIRVPPPMEFVAPPLAQAVPPQLPKVVAPPVAPTKSPSAPSGGLRATLLAVVAEKTGYPSDMLSLEMELEADLGIDSIKRVEILAAMQERVQGLPEVKPNEMAALRTLGQVVAFLDRCAPAAAATPRPTHVDSTPTIGPVNAASHANGDLRATLLEVVAEKTGYPADMLTPEMELEADLGIDSIKRVEILAAMQQRVPGLPEVRPAEMAALRTLGQVAARIHDGKGERREAMAPVATRAASPAVASLTVADVHEREAPASGASIPGLFSSGPVYVTEDGFGVAAALARRLVERGLEAQVIGEPPADARAVIFLGGLRHASTKDAIAANRDAFRIARALANAGIERGGVFVTVRGNQPAQSWSAGLSGLAKTAALEWPLAGVRAIDVSSAGRTAEDIAAVLADEILAGGHEVEVSRKTDGRRVTLHCEPAAPLLGPIAADERSVIVAAGGARGVTAACLVALARRARPRFVLLGRTVLGEEPAACRGLSTEAELSRAWLDAERGAGRSPSPAALRAAVRDVLAQREVRATLAALAVAGSQAVYRSVDVQSTDAVRAALAEVRGALGPVTGIVQGAGVIADKRIAEKSDEQWQRVFDTKVLGLATLLEATASDPLRMIVGFSSVAGRYGNVGQSDYAMGNEVVAKVLAEEARRRGPGCVVRALHWGPWDGGMVDASLKSHFAEQGMELIPLEAGARAFVDQLAVASKTVEVVIGGNGAPLARPERQIALEFHVSAATHAFLEGHRVKGVPVLPVVLALDWFARAAAACRPDLVLAEVNDLRVRRGVRLQRFHGTGDTLRVTCREISNGSGARLQLELRSLDGTLHYSGEATMASALPLAADAEPPPHAGDAPPWPASDLYASLLFHEGRFRVIRQLESLSERAGVAEVAGVSGADWPGAWKLDAAALDGALQLAILIGQRALGQASLPTRVGSLRVFLSGPASGIVRCRIQAKDVSPLRTLSDITLEDADGRRIAELRDVELHVVASESQSLTERAQPALS